MLKLFLQFCAWFNILLKTPLLYKINAEIENLKFVNFFIKTNKTNIIIKTSKELIV